MLTLSLQDMRRLPTEWAWPSSKSHSMRALLFAATCGGFLHNVLETSDTANMLLALQRLGVVWQRLAPGYYQVTRFDNNIDQSKQYIIDAGNSGQVARFVPVWALAQGFSNLLITGDASLEGIRDFSLLGDALIQLGVQVDYLGRHGYLPVRLTGKLEAGNVVIDGEDSQPVSALLLGLSLLSQVSVVRVINPGEVPWIKLTLSWLERMGWQYQQLDDWCFRVGGPQNFVPFIINIPLDASQIAHGALFHLLSGKRLTISKSDLDATQGDSKFLAWLFENEYIADDLAEDGGFGQLKPGSALINDDVSAVNAIGVERGNVSSSQELRVIRQDQDCWRIVGKYQLAEGTYDLNAMIDLVPVIAVLATVARGPVTLTNIASARTKESDRVADLAKNLAIVGIKTTVCVDSLTIYPGRVIGGVVDACADHRLAMAFGVLATQAAGDIKLVGAAAVRKTFPGFWEQLLGGNCPPLLEPKQLVPELFLSAGGELCSDLRLSGAPAAGRVTIRLADGVVDSIVVDFSDLSVRLWGIAHFILGNWLRVGELHDFCIIGLPGVGKSTVLKELSRWFGMQWRDEWGQLPDFIDGDDLVATGLGGQQEDLRRYWRQYGEKAFREAEFSAYAQAPWGKGRRLVAGGGGCGLAPKMEKLLCDKVCIIYLPVHGGSLSRVKERLIAIYGDSRIDKIRQEMEIRNKLYRHVADITVLF